MIVYVASPYSHPNFFVRLWRFIRVCIFSARLMLEGNVVFSPIAHSFPIEFFGMRGRKGFDFWMDQDLPMLDCASRLVVLKIRGWEKSKGVEREIARARERGIPVVYAYP